VKTTEKAVMLERRRFYHYYWLLQILIQWLPKKTAISELLESTPESKIQIRTPDIPATVKVSYQNTVTLNREEESIQLTGRTLEEAFAFENLDWSQDISNKDLRLRVKSSDNPTIEITAERLHKRIHSKNFKKTDFALALLTKNNDDWVVPSYIKEGLEWLKSEIIPNTPSVIEANITTNQEEE
jgi:hypothetical protein